MSQQISAHLEESHYRGKLGTHDLGLATHLGFAGLRIIRCSEPNTTTKIIRRKRHVAARSPGNMNSMTDVHRSAARIDSDLTWRVQEWETSGGVDGGVE